MEPIQQKPILTVPVAIVIAGAIIAGALIYMKSPSPARQMAQQPSFEQEFKGVTAQDHIFGNPTAKIKIVEYSDPSCPFCKVFHNTMRNLMSTYGTTGNVAWVYRSYPLDKPSASGSVLHPNAGRESQALECAASLGGNDKFWAYTNRLYEITPAVTQNSPQGLNLNELPNIAKFVGLNVTDFNNCLSTGKFAEKIEKEYLDGVNIGIQGTPTSIIVLDKAFPATIKEKIMQIFEQYKNAQTGEYPVRLSVDSKLVMLDGAMPLDTMKATIDLLSSY
jgi:protein-disulfide isomerase